jgi:MFS family permease
MSGNPGRLLPIVLIAVGSVLGLAATDLVLPAIPILPEVVSGTAESAQWVLAAFAFGTGAGLLLFGELGARFRLVNILIVSLLAFAILSYLATQVQSLIDMSIVRFLQGIAASASAVYAPVMIRQLYDGPAAVAMIGRLGSIESIAPAIAPIVGVFLLHQYGWQSSFHAIAAVASLLSIAWFSVPRLKQQFGRLETMAGGYTELLLNARFIRYALSQACTLGAILIIVFSAPKVVTAGMGGELSDFIVMQVLGITFFVIAANMTGVFTRWWGTERTIFIGSAMSALGCIAIWLMTAINQPSIYLLWFFFIFVNLGLGIRGPVGFYQALLASGDNDSRGSALIILLVMLLAAGGTGAVAPFIEAGLYPVAIVAMTFAVTSVLLLGLPGKPQSADD